MIGAFLNWWFGQLTQLLPDWLRRSATTRADALVIAPAGRLDDVRSVTAGLRRRGKETSLGEFALASARLADLSGASRRPAVLRLTRADLLEKTLVMPLAAQHELDQALAFEMDRETPFAADEIYWNHSIESIARGRLSIRLFLIAKTRLSPLLGALAHAGIVPQWAEIADGDAALPVLPLNGDRRPQQRSQRLVWAAAACCAVLAIAAAAAPFVRQASELAALDRQLRAGQSVAAESDSLRRQIEHLSGGFDLVNSELDKAGRPLEILAAVTRLLPDDTYLTELTLRQRKLLLSGRSARAARLIGLLAADSRFENPGFAAPVTRIEALRAEVFTIAAEVGGGR